MCNVFQNYVQSTGQLKLRDKIGKNKTDALIIFTMALKFLKEHLYDTLNQQGKQL